jgi:hypothetical protein
MTEMSPLSDDTRLILSTIPHGEQFINAYEQYMTDGIYVGSITDFIAEASDASASGAPIEDGMSG